MQHDVLENRNNINEIFYSEQRTTGEFNLTVSNDDCYIAHRREEDKEMQSVSAHNRETAQLAERYCTVESLTQAAFLAGIYHDGGKYSSLFQTYIQQEKEEACIRRGEVNHATAGGILIEKLVPKSSLSEVLQIAIYSHHGIYDAIDLKTGQALIEKRQDKDYQEREKIELDFVEEQFYRYTNKAALDTVLGEAQKAFKLLIQEIKDFAKKDSQKIYGSRDFYMGMYERLLLSLLIDADSSNTSQFMNHVVQEQLPTKEAMDRIWKDCIEHFETERVKFQTDTKINSYRSEISEACFQAAGGEGRLYRLTLPTGAGKTLSCLRFALNHAKIFQKQRIIYVAPFTSILEQNAEEIRRMVGNPDIVLEHHCNVIFEKEEDQKKYSQLTENWMSPVIATTAVQFLNTLFSSKKGSIRRMHSLCDSIIIFDEIQALPVQIISLFNLAVNFLTVFCNTTVVLCSATQPVFDKLPKNRLLPPKEIVGNYIHYDNAFRRVTLFDRTGMKPGGLSVKELGEFVLEQSKKEKQQLVIVNTKGCAKKLYDYLKPQLDKAVCLFHLSTNMCAFNRQEILERIKGLLAEKCNPKPIICISTQLIEAGVDLSFGSVIRSLAGLDNIIQAAGRCNRHGERENGKVYIVKMSDEAENLAQLKDIRTAQNVMEELLYCYREKPEIVGGDLLSDQAKKQYYLRYLHEQERYVDFPVDAYGIPTNLVELLSGNQPGCKQYFRFNGKQPKFMIKQAFKTAGDLFEVISEAGKINVVVEYDQQVTLLIETLQDPYISIEKKKGILRELQLVTVGISEQVKNKLGRAITPICDGLISVLNLNYYSKETGVSLEPVGMELLDF